MDDRLKTTAQWLQPPAEQEGLSRFVETVRERLWLVVVAIVAATGAAVLYVGTADKVYEAEADLLVTPVSADSAVSVSLGLIRESTDPTRDVETASRLVTTIDVADRVKQELGTDMTAQELLDDVEAEPVAQSNIVAITARNTSPEFARELANGFAEQTVEERTGRLHQQIDAVLPGLTARAEAESATTDPTSLQAQVAELETLRDSDDPTMQVETLASTPKSPVEPRPLLSIAGGVLIGLVLGVGGAFAAQALDPRLRREEQLRRLYRLPILTRVPKESRARRLPLSPMAVSPATLEAYRTLRGTLTGASELTNGARAILVTGPSPSEGKTTTAVNLAASLAVSNKRVILIEADLRRPAIAKTLQISPETGVVSVLLENTSIQDAVVTTDAFGPNLELLVADYEGGWITELFSLPAAHRLLTAAKELADYVIIDSPPLTDVVDALPLATMVDDVLIVVRLGKSRLSNIHRLAELLAENEITPAGFAVVGVPRPALRRSGYYSYTRRGHTAYSEPQSLLRAGEWKRE